MVVASVEPYARLQIHVGVILMVDRLCSLSINWAGIHLLAIAPDIKAKGTMHPVLLTCVIFMGFWFMYTSYKIWMAAVVKE